LGRNLTNYENETYRSIMEQFKAKSGSNVFKVIMTKFYLFFSRGL